MVVQTNKGSVKLFGATIEVATVWENNRPEKTSNLYEEAKVRRKRGEQEAATPREKESESTGAAPSVKTEQKEVAASKRVRVPLYPTKEKPSKVLCCPRCHSLNTKFCYFNNYNANQPRHFCRACQRYWTDGGVMRRTMPVGAGRRKSKSNSSHRSHLTIYGAAALQNIPSSIVEACGHHHPQQATDKANNASTGDRVLPPNRDDGVWNPTKASSMTTCSSIIKEEPRGGFHVFQDPCLRTGCPFPSTWNPPHAFSASSHLPLSFYLTQNTTCFISQLGTHSRDGSSRIGNPNNHVETDEEDMWLRKAMRIDDPNGAFKCSKWNGAMGEDETSSRESHL